MALDFGIEIECLIPGDTSFTPETANGVATSLSQAGIPCTFLGYTHRQIGTWKIVTDMSINRPQGYVGLEIVSPPLNDARLDEIETVCRVLREAHARTNRSCGLHVHISARHMNIPALKRLAFLYIENEDVVDSLMPPSRRGNLNTYCASLKSRANATALNDARDVRQIAAALSNHPFSSYDDPSRYVKLNFMSFVRHGTVEFRQHSGTIDPMKIIRWVQFCGKMVDTAVATERQPNIVQASLNPPRGRARKTIFEMAMRPDGVTNVELQNMLGRRSQTSVPSVLKRLGFTVRADGTRNGNKVYKLVVPNAPTEEISLAGLLAKIAVTAEEAEFWNERYQILLRGATQNGEGTNAEVT